MARIPTLHFHWHRFSERAGSGRGVENVFRPQRRPLDPDTAIAPDDSLRAREKAIWLAGAAFFIVCGLITPLADSLPSTSGFEIPADLTGPWQYGAGGVAIMVGLAMIACAHRNVPVLPWMPPSMAAALVLITVAVLGAPQYGLELMGLFVLPAIAACFYLPTRFALPIVLAALGALGYIGYYNRDEQYGVVQAAMMAMFMIGSSVIMVLARDRIQRGIELNIEVAGRDPLTGAANLRRLRARLDDEIRRAKRRNLPVTLVVVDLEDFGEVNARFSHSLGDAVLVACARAMQKVIRKDELLARRGDDEFAVVAVGETADELKTLVDRLRQAVTIERRRLCPDVAPTATVGYATWRQGESTAALMRRADSALHIGRMSGPEDL